MLGAEVDGVGAAGEFLLPAVPDKDASDGGRELDIAFAGAVGESEVEGNETVGVRRAAGYARKVAGFGRDTHGAKTG